MTSMITVRAFMSFQATSEDGTDLHFAEDISLLSNTVEQACTLLLVVKKECKNIVLGLNARKTKVMPLNIKANEINVKTMDCTQLDAVDDFT